MLTIRSAEPGAGTVNVLVEKGRTIAISEGAAANLMVELSPDKRQ